MAASGGETVRKAHPTGVPAVPSPGPTARTRSIWLTQLVLTGSVVCITAVVQIFSPNDFSSWMYAAGLAIIIGLTAAALIVPWTRVPRDAVLVLPYGDIIGIGLLVAANDLQFGFLWVFPIFWIATHFALPALIAALLGVAGLIVGEAAISPPNGNLTLQLVIVILSLTFIGLTSWQSARQTRAFKQLLRRQSSRQQGTIQRVSSQERRVTQMLNALDVGIARLALDGDILAVNDTYADLYSLNRDDPTQPGRAVEYASLRGEALSEFRRPLARAIRGEVFEDERVWLFDGNGKWHALSASTRILDSLGSEPLSTLLIVHDITDLIEAERAREHIATVVSHELRNPLTAIIGHAELALEDDSLAPSTREQLEVIDHASQRMQTLIGEILTRTQTRRVESGYARVDARRILESSLESFQPAAVAQGVRVSISIPEPLPVHGDGFRLRQVIDNLLSNAIKYTPREGTVTISGSVDDGAAVMMIVDSGIGISRSDLPHVFEPYFRAETARESSTPGTGLGMGIARDIITEHDGALDIESEPGAGTTITLRLPLADKEEEG
ncbi:PAS domain S-box-containing protein [Microbacterium endophyticum]|uniref:Sensor-like histidine kinase SenX3 n=1 Tax=Microbacterium endophyticum TaxID=1526412 RepID=A0A7W4V2R4_9MICO|nr:HAMP domain-containing sensor histidine kinase [Microbacterium endophyticum]MBB2975469.1 PAS domain S-box-containing protein [Microbacterium endophyticum]NIK35512.1 PAS domain S-box-containing protein [Microbacterium endophyticum]